jgi:hypothetical protein
MEYTQTSFNRIMGPTANISAAGSGARILGSTIGNSGKESIYSQASSARKQAYKARALAEEMDPMLREERISREAYAKEIRKARERNAMRNTAMAQSSWGQMTGRSPIPIKSPGSGPWSYSSF